MPGWFVALAVFVWILQTALGFWQFKKFSNHLKQMRAEGRVAIGRAKKHYRNMGSVYPRVLIIGH